MHRFLLAVLVASLCSHNVSAQSPPLPQPPTLKSTFLGRLRAPTSSAPANPASVKTIGKSAFGGGRSLTSVSVAPENQRFQAVDGVLFTADGKTLIAFPAAKKATKYAIPDGVKTVGDNAFSFCASLTSVEIPASVETIGISAFGGGRSLTSFSVAPANPNFRAVDGVLFTADGKTLIAFPAAKKATKYAIPDGVETVGDNAFGFCTSLTSVKIPASVKKIGARAFAFRLTLYGAAGSVAEEYAAENELRFDDNLDGINDDTSPILANGFEMRTENGGGVIVKFLDKTAKSAVVPAQIVGRPVVKIGDRAFSDCESLTSVEIPDGVETIGDSAFAFCKSLTSVEIPDGVKTIGDDAFGNCKSLTSVEIPNSVETIGDSAFWNCESLTSVEIPDGVKTIGDDAFNGCESLTSVEIPASVEAIGDEAFGNCHSLTSFSVAPGAPNFQAVAGVLFSADRKTLIAFPTAKKAAKYLIPNGVETVGDDAFNGCASLKSVKIPASVKKIGDEAFGNCHSLTSFSVASANPNFRAVAGVLFTADRKTLIAFPAAKKATEYAIPTGVETVGASAFSFCDSLTSVKIPASVKEIGDSAFAFCASLTSVEIPDGVETVGDDAFAFCRSLTSVKIPASVKKIGVRAFNNCDSLTSVEIPASVEKIDGQAFEGCSADLTLYGAAGSVAEKYAAENGLRFEAR